MPLVVNLVAYQCAWLACIFALAQQRLALGLLVATGAVAVHLLIARQPRRELMLIGVAAVAGAAFESVLVATGWVRFGADSLVGNLVPVLMVVLWAVFATTLNVSLRWLRDRPLVCALVAAASAPLAYLAGARLGAMEWISAPAALLLISAGWAILLPLLMRVAVRFDGFARA